MTRRPLAGTAEHWVVVKGTEIIGVYADVDQAAAAAHERLGEQPYLLRQVKPIPFVLPSCMIVPESLIAWTTRMRQLVLRPHP